MRAELGLALACAFATFGCRSAPSDVVGHMESEFVYETLAFSPVSATQAGYHSHDGRRLDELLDDMTENGLNRQRDFYERFRIRLQSLGDRKVAAEDQADVDIMRNQTELALLELNSIQGYRHNPTVYVELIGNALFGPYVLEYAPRNVRFQHIIARLQKIPDFLTQARVNLDTAPAVWIRVAVEENEGNIALIDQTLRKECPPGQKENYEGAAQSAIDALKAFNSYLQGDLIQHPGEWRLGAPKYRLKFRYALGTERNPSEVLADAETQLTTIRDQMGRAAGAETVDKALNVIAQKHATPDTYFDEAKGDLAETTSFVRDHRIVSLPAGGNLQVIPTPEFMRGVYGVGGFSPAPALEPKLGAFYWVTPVPKTWPKERQESKLREYDFYGLKILTVHEAMPGHYVQAQYADEVRPESRRLLRAVYGNVPYVEGWAVYATQTMIEDGYFKNDSGMQLTWYKQLLRVIANTILDIRLQTMNMSEQQALDLMIKDTYQEKEEAIAKYQRAQLSSAQLPAYFLGWRGWVKLRGEAQTGAHWDEAGFHEAALKEGAVPVEVLRDLILKK